MDVRQQYKELTLTHTLSFKMHGFLERQVLRHRDRLMWFTNSQEASMFSVSLPSAHGDSFQIIGQIVRRVITQQLLKISSPWQVLLFWIENRRIRWVGYPVQRLAISAVFAYVTTRVTHPLASAHALLWELVSPPPWLASDMFSDVVLGESCRRFAEGLKSQRLTKELRWRTKRKRGRDEKEDGWRDAGVK